MCLLLQELKAKSTNKNRAYPFVRMKRFGIMLNVVSGLLGAEELELCMGPQRLGFDCHPT